MNPVLERIKVCICEELLFSFSSAIRFYWWEKRRQLANKNASLFNCWASLIVSQIRIRACDDGCLVALASFIVNIVFIYVVEESATETRAYYYQHEWKNAAKKKYYIHKRQFWRNMILEKERDIYETISLDWHITKACNIRHIMLIMCVTVAPANANPIHIYKDICVLFFPSYCLSFCSFCFWWSGHKFLQFCDSFNRKLWVFFRKS